jgi:mono/diheme cytochrome c family protein
VASTSLSSFPTLISAPSVPCRLSDGGPSNGQAISKMPITTKSTVTKNTLTKNTIWRAGVRIGAMVVLGAALSPVSVSAQDAAKIEAGEDVFSTNCAICHGEQLVSTGQTFDLRRLKDNERARFENSVRNGKNQMPPWKGKLTDEEIDQLWHYIRANAYQK